MATRLIPDQPGEVRLAIVEEYDALIANLKRAGVLLHGDKPAVTDLISAPDSTDTATCVVLVNQAKARWNAHIAQTTKHLTADATNVTAAADATNDATAQTLVNELKADFNAHHDVATWHTIGGQGGQAVLADISTADGTDAATTRTLANAFKLAYNRHVSLGAPDVALVAS